MNNNNIKEYFTEKEALEIIRETLKWFDQDYSELHSEAFNTDYYIIGTHKAKQALEQYGTFKAIQVVQEYEQEQFGKIITDLSNPEQIANVLFYIISENVIYNNKTIRNFIDDNEQSEPNNERLMKIVDQLINQLNN